VTSKIIVILKIVTSLLQAARFYLYFHARSLEVSYGDCIISYADAYKPISLVRTFRRLHVHLRLSYAL